MIKCRSLPGGPPSSTVVTAGQHWSPVSLNGQISMNDPPPPAPNTHTHTPKIKNRKWPMTDYSNADVFRLHVPNIGRVRKRREKIKTTDTVLVGVLQLAIVST